MNTSTAKWMDENRDELILTLQKAVSFNSERDDSTAASGQPFGKGPKDCLDYVLGKAKEMGFETKDLDGYCGCIDFGEGEEQLGILAHLDVVPAGNGWTYPPYGGDIHDGYLFGRGTLDDKGPAIAALYALKAVKECGIPLKRRVRIILGCNEESGMACLEHYNEVEPMPTLSFSPDADYPVINSEKMIFRSEFRKEYASSIKMDAGTVRNAVAGEADFTVKVPAEIVEAAVKALNVDPAFKFDVSSIDGGTKVHVTGVAAHAASPQMGKNALCAALQLMKALPLGEEDLKTAAGLAELLQFDCHGEHFGIDSEDASGRLTMNVGVCNWDETGIRRLTVDIRAPISSDADFLRAKLIEGFGKAGLAEYDNTWSNGYYIPPESELVSKLMAIYNDHFHDDAKPHAIGGGTYARHMKNAVAFGPERQGEPCNIHMADESISVECLVDDAKIYADAIIAFAGK